MQCKFDPCIFNLRLHELISQVRTTKTLYTHGPEASSSESECYSTKTLWQPTDISTISLVSQQIMGPQFQSVQFSNLSFVACHFFSVDVT